MTALQFSNMNEDARYEVVKKQGELLTELKGNDHHYQLFQLHDFFVEIISDVSAKVYKSILVKE